MKITSYFKAFLLSMMLPIMACSSDDDNPQGTTNGTFVLTFNGENCSGKGKRITVPMEGATYTFDIEASEGVEWSITPEETTSDDFFTITHTGTQKGNANVEVKIGGNTEKGTTRKGTLKFSNTANKMNVSFTFEQNDKLVLIPSTDFEFTHEQFMNNDPSIKYGVDYSIEGPNTIVIWDKVYGKDPSKGTDMPFVPEEMLDQCEFSYNFIIDELGFADRTTSCATRYKQIIIITGNRSGGAVGFGRQYTAEGKGEDGAGILKLCYNHVNLAPGKVTGTVHHELCHCFQYISHYDSKLPKPHNFGWSGPIYEMTSQWAGLSLYKYYGVDEYIWEENHMQAYLKNTHRAFMHPDNQYHNPFTLMFWEWKHEKIVSKMWKEVIKEDNNDAVVTYKRLNNLTQEQFNDEMFESACRLISWDLPVYGKQYEKYIDTHTYDLEKSGISMYRPTKETCPQNYGYNCIKLKVPKAGTNVKVTFAGNTSADYNVKNISYRGWRWGFVAMKENGERIYDEPQKTIRGERTFTVPEGTKYLWFVVMGAPTKHVKQSDSKEGQWPYTITLSGTEPDTPTSFPEL